jgi:hypothetical protein
VALRRGNRCRRRRGRAGFRGIRRMGDPQQCGHAGAARRTDTGRRTERHGRLGVAASDIGGNLRRRIRPRRISGAGPLHKPGRSGDLVDGRGIHAAGAAGCALCPHRASRPLDPVRNCGGDPGCGLCGRDRDPDQARRSSGPGGRNRAVRHRGPCSTGAGIDVRAGKRLAHDRAGTDVARHRLDLDAAADPVPARAGGNPRRHCGDAHRRAS